MGPVEDDKRSCRGFLCKTLNFAEKKLKFVQSSKNLSKSNASLGEIDNRISEFAGKWLENTDTADFAMQVGNVSGRKKLNSDASQFTCRA
jgi:CRISPR/Cas system CMR-associated protein Cmr5 small subunit